MKRLLSAILVAVALAGCVHKSDVRISLPDEAAKHGLSRISENLYMSVRNHGKGDSIREGDIVFVSADYRRADSVDLEFPSSEILRVGSMTMPGVVTEALTRMRQGDTAELATTAMSLFGTRADIIDLRPEDVVLVTLSVSDVVNPDTTANGANLAL